MKHSVFTALLFCAACASSPPSETAETPAAGQVTFVYEDLDAFGASLRAIDAGADPGDEMRNYVANATPAFDYFAGRHGVTAEAIASELAELPRYYRYLTTLKPELQAREPEFRNAMLRLRETAPPGSAPVPVYYIVANHYAGGQPGYFDTPEGRQYFFAVAIDALGMSDRVDRSEFSNSGAGHPTLDDLPYVMIHETAHVYQRQFQGEENYVSIYRVEGRGTNLAYAVREGCADFLTTLSSGWRFGNRDAYVAAHEAELWAQFEPIMHEQEDGASGWFGGRTDAHPDWPMQVGYGVGAALCRTYYNSAPDKRAALTAIYGAYLPEHFEAIAAPYVARMGG